MKTTAFPVALLVAGVCSFTAAAVPAQTASTPADGEGALEEVAITGSRIITNGNDAPTPVTVITPEQILATKPTTLYENLIDMPVFSGSRGATNSSVEQSSQGQSALSVLNLRNMGSERNLVLLDGRRIPPASADGLVDVSAIPQLLVQRVDVVTGGVSAVYGSDAITGVTNFVIDRNFNGVKTNLQRGISGQGDGKSYEFGLAGGTQLFGGRGHIEASYQRRQDDGLLVEDRDWASPFWTIQGDGVTIPWHLQGDVRNATASYGGVFVCPNGTINPAGCLLNGQPRPLVGQTFNQNGFASPYNYGLTGAANGLTLSAVQIGGDGVALTQVSLRSEQLSDQGFLRFDYELADNVDVFVVGSLTNSNVWGTRGTQRTFSPGWRIGACNAFLPTQYQTALGCTTANSGTAAEPVFQFSKSFKPSDHYGIAQVSEFDARNYYVLAGLEGNFGEGYRWDTTYTHSQSRMALHSLNQNRNNISAALDAVVNPANGQIVCRVTLTNPADYPGCVPINVFGPTSETREMMDYIVKTVENQTDTKLDGFAGSITGAPLTGWAGPIGMAVSAELRRLTLDLTSTARADGFLSCVGLRFGNCTPGVTIPHGGALLPISGVNQTVAEGAYEINLPLVKDWSIFDAVTFNGAARYTKYQNDPNDAAVVSRDFNATTWKAGLVWSVNDALTLRWSRSRDIRAPSLYDLYLPVSAGVPNQQFDYLLPGAPQVAATPKTGGNPFLVPEVAHTTTIGIVWRPNAQFSIALDAYDITLRDALYSLAGASRPIQEACYASGGASPLCQLQERPNGFTDTSFANQMTAHYTRFVNIAEQTTSGIDLETSFNSTVRERPLSLRALVTYQPHLYKYIPFSVRHDVAGVAYPGIGGQPAPVWKASLFARYKVSDRWAVDLSERFRSRLDWSSNPTETEVGGVPSVMYTNLTVSYDVPTALQRVNVFLNVQNLFDKDPPPAGVLGGTFPGQVTYALGDDTLGRYFVLGARLSF
jgi:iron complex outermembrane receptor protein